MTCLDLFEQSVDDYVAAFRSMNTELLVFQHVPKTAGSSVHLHLSQLDNGYHWLSDETEDSWDRFLSQHQSRPFRLLRGHLKSALLDDLDRRGISSCVVSFLREPRQQTISHFRYCHSESCPQHQELRARYPDIMSFTRHYLGPNFSTTYMVGHCDSADEAIDRIRRRYAFIGLTEFYNASMFVLMKCLGCEFRSQPRENVTRSQYTVDELMSDEFIDHMQSEYAIDLAVHEYFQQRYCAVADKVVELLLNQSTVTGGRDSPFTGLLSRLRMAGGRKS